MRYQWRLGVLVGFIACGGASSNSAWALQPLQDFVRAAQRNNPDNLEARATFQQRAAQSQAATGAYLPSLTVQAWYTYNQYDAVVTLPNGPTLTILPHHGLDASVTLAVPVVNIGAWRQKQAATANEATALASKESAAVNVEMNVTQTYYQVLGAAAVRYAATQNVEVAENNANVVRDRMELGTASELDYQRALADLARARRDAAAAEQELIRSQRVLESLARLTPEPVSPSDYIEDDLREERPLAQWLGTSSSELLTVKPSVLAIEAAERSRSAARAAWIPTLAVQGQQRFTNAGGFTGRSNYLTVMATATGRLDFSLSPNVKAQSAAVEAARAREDKARRAAEDGIFQAWHQVNVGLEKARAARAQVQSATLAQQLAKERYAGGVATQLEVVQAQRDFFTAAVAQAQADFDLMYARALLRLAARRAGQTEASP